LPMIMAFLAMFVISRYPLSDAYVDKMNHTLKEKNS
jgi:glycoside/pentoside/hexuronide:cation symporter, GPH family